MAEEIKKDESTVRKIKDPDFSKEVTIDRLNASKEMIDWHYSQMKKALGEKATEEEIWKRINSLVLRDNIFNEAMKIIVPCYEINIPDSQLKILSDGIRKANPSLETAPEEYTKMMARRMMEKQMIFGILAREWKVEVTDDEAKKVLEAYYKATNQPIRDILNDEKQMNGIKNTIMEQKMADLICSKLKWKANWDAIKENAKINNAQVLKQQENKPEEAKPTTPIEK